MVASKTGRDYHWHMEVAPGIHWIDRVRLANSYLVSGPKMIVIDTGMPDNADNIARYIRRLGRDIQDLQWIVLTHADIDHSGSATRLRGMTGAKIAIHTADAPMVSGQAEMKRMRGIRALLFRAMTRVAGFRPFRPDVLLNEGDEIGDLKVLHTPGHTPGSMCLYRPGAALFSGDAFRTDRKVNLQPPPARMTLSRRQAIDSVKRIAQLDFDVLLPGHGRPLTGHASRQLQNLVADDRA